MHYSRARRFAEALLIGLVIVASLGTAGGVATLLRHAHWDRDGIRAARWEAGWIVERGAAGFGDLTTDPWGRAWIQRRSAADSWVCSQGPHGNGLCPPLGLGTPAAARAGSVGHSARFGDWEPRPPRWPTLPMAEQLPLIVGAIPWLAFIAYRVCRRLRGKPRFRLGGGGPMALVVFYVLFLAASFVVPYYANETARARAVRVEADTQALGSAIEMYRKATGVLPRQLEDVTRPVTGRDGKPAGPFFARLPASAAGVASDHYAYRRRADGSFRVEWRPIGGPPVFFYGD